MILLPVLLSLTLSAHLQYTFTGHTEVMRQVAFSSDGQVLATGSTCNLPLPVTGEGPRSGGEGAPGGPT
jgi:WD40 repeat protein